MSSPPSLQVTTHDDPRVMREAATEDFSQHVVPTTWRSGRLSLSMAWLALFGSMFWFVLAGSLALVVGTRDTLIALLLATVVFGVVNAVLARYAARTGITVAAFSRSLFGRNGATIAVLVYAATAIYYVVFEASVIGVAFHAQFGGISLKVWYLVVILYSAPLVFGGVQRWLDRFNGVLLPLYLIAVTVAVVWAISEYGYSGAWFSYEPAAAPAVSGPGWWYAFTTFFGIWVIMLYTWDYARLAKPADSEYHAKVTFGPVFYFATIFVNGVVGIFLAHTIPVEGGVSETSVVLGLVQLMGIAGLLLVWISQTRINTVNLYVASVNVQAFFARVTGRNVSRVVWVVVAGAISYLLMLTDIFSFLLDALRYQGVVVVAWVTIALTHILSPAARRFDTTSGPEFRPGRVPAWNPAGLTAWVGASAVGILLLVLGGSFGTTWAAPITLVLAAGTYAAGLRLAPRRWFVLDRPHDPRDEVADPWASRVACGTCHRSYLALELDRDPSDAHAPICAACADTSLAFGRAARHESASPTSAPTPTAAG